MMPFLIETETEFRCSMGQFIIDNMVLVGEPNTIQSKSTIIIALAITFHTDAIDESIPDNSNTETGTV